MNIYTRKNNWKIFLFLFAVLIILLTIWFSHNFLKKIALDEKASVQIWANAISKKAHLVNYTKKLFDDLQNQERRSVYLWSEATKRIINANDQEDIKFYTEIITGNENIPVIVVNEDGQITARKNVSAEYDTISQFTDSIKKQFSSYPPIEVNYYADLKIYIYYQNSKVYNQLKHTLDDLVKSFLNEVVENSISSPVIILDSIQSKIITYGGDADTTDHKLFIELSHEPIIVEMPGYGTSYIYYQDSPFIQQFRYFPVVLLLIIGLFLVISYIMFSISRKAEQNQVWAGMAKESAHQLGTPISSLIGWVEILREKQDTEMEASEMLKDIDRLQQVSERFSKIGSKPELAPTEINSLIENNINYMRRRSSSRIEYVFEPSETEIVALINPLLFNWVLENLIKNALDAMDGKGKIIITSSIQGKRKIIDITDTGKGIPKSKQRTIFNPGYSTKSRGWGLGLSLAKRIIKDYHRGKIFVKSSTIDQGTTFRIIVK